MSDVQKKHVLLMDDEPMIQKVSGQMLENLGYSVTLASNGEEAVSHYRSAMEKGESFYCVIMDLQIVGGMGAEETLKMLVEMDSGVKAVVSTGYANDPQVTRHRDHGFAGALVKPYKLIELKEVLEII